jgi:hypothetical protein
VASLGAGRGRMCQQVMMFKTNILKQSCYSWILLCVLYHLCFSHSQSVIRPIVGAASVFALSEYALYWGITFFSGIEIRGRHKVFATADLAPIGLLVTTDVASDSKIQHYGVTLNYLYKFKLANSLLALEPGATLGVLSIPCIYGTFPSPYLNEVVSTDMISSKTTTRENVFGIGPELRISIGINKLQFYVDGRSYFTINKTMILTNVGVLVNL